MSTISEVRAKAEQGDATAQYNLASHYERGLGVPEDLVEAYAWYDLAAVNGDKIAAMIRDKIMVECMEPEQVTEAQARSRDLAAKIAANTAGEREGPEVAEGGERSADASPAQLRIAEAVRVGKEEILSDARNRFVSANVTTFSELHDFVDANEYGGLCAEDSVWSIEDASAVQDALNEWLQAGGLEEVCKRIRVDSLQPGDEFELFSETMGLDPGTYTYIGSKDLAQWELADSVYVESRFGERFVIPEDTSVGRFEEPEIANESDEDRGQEPPARSGGIRM